MRTTAILLCFLVALSPTASRADECSYLVSGLKSLGAAVDKSQTENLFHVTLGTAEWALAYCYRPFVRVSFEFENKSPPQAFYRDASAIAAAIDGGSSGDIRDSMAACAGVAAARPKTARVKFPFDRGLVECTVSKEDRGLAQFDVSVRKEGSDFRF